MGALGKMLVTGQVSPHAFSPLKDAPLQAASYEGGGLRNGTESITQIALTEHFVLDTQTIPSVTLQSFTSCSFKIKL